MTMECEWRRAMLELRMMPGVPGNKTSRFVLPWLSIWSTGVEPEVSSVIGWVSWPDPCLRFGRDQTSTQAQLEAELTMEVAAVHPASASSAGCNKAVLPVG